MRASSKKREAPEHERIALVRAGDGVVLAVAGHWSPPPGFPGWLAAQRERSGLTMRQAASRISFSFAAIGRLETGVYPGRPNLTLLARLANLYGVPEEEMHRQAGLEPAPAVFHDATSPQERAAAIFDALMHHPEIRSQDEIAGWSRLVAPEVKRLVMRAMENLVNQNDPRAFLARCGGTDGEQALE